MPLGLLLDFFTDTYQNSLVGTAASTYSLYDNRLKMSIIELNEMLGD